MVPVLSTQAHHSTFLPSFLSKLICPILLSLVSFTVLQAQDITGLEIIRTLEHDNYSIAALDCYFVDDHQLIAYSNNSGFMDGDTLVIYDFQQDQVLAEVPGTIWSYEIRFIDGDQLLYKNDNILYQLIHFSAPEITELLSNVYTFTLTDDKNTVAMLRYFNNAYQVEVADYNSMTGALVPLDTFELPAEPNTGDASLVFSSDNSYIALNGGYENDFVFIINTGTGTVSQVNTPVNQGTYSPVFYMHNGKLRLAVGGGYANGSIEMIDVEALAPEASFPVFPFYMYALALDPTENFLACGGYDGLIKLFRVQDTELTEIDSSDVGLINKLIFTQDGQYLISCHGPSSVGSIVHIHRVLRESSAVTPVRQEKLILLPNPAKDMLHLDGIQDARVSIFDVHGRLVWQGYMTGSSVDIRALAEGLYWVKADDGKESRVNRFLKS